MNINTVSFISILLAQCWKALLLNFLLRTACCTVQSIWTFGGVAFGTAGFRVGFALVQSWSFSSV